MVPLLLYSPIILSSSLIAPSSFLQPHGGAAGLQCIGHRSWRMAAIKAASEHHHKNTNHYCLGGWWLVVRVGRVIKRRTKTRQITINNYTFKELRQNYCNLERREARRFSGPTFPTICAMMNHTYNSLTTNVYMICISIHHVLYVHVLKSPPSSSKILYTKNRSMSSAYI